MSTDGIESAMAIERAMPGRRLTRNEPAPDPRAWLETARSQPASRAPTDRAHDGGPWLGPSEAAWTMRLLRGAPLPR